MPTNSTSRLLLPLILGVASMLRLYRLTFQSLRHDEHFSRFTSSLPTLAEAIDRGAVQDKHPPGYTIFLHGWIRAFGDDELTLRLPSVIAGVLTVYVVYLLGRELFSERVGLVSAAFCAVSEQPLRFSQDARAYAMLMLGSALCVLLAVRLSRGKGSTPAWMRVIGLTVTAAVTSYLHYFGLLLVALLGGYQLTLVLRKRVHWLHWTGAYVGAALLYLPWIIVTLGHARQTQSWMKPPSARVLWNVFVQLSGHNPWVPLLAVAAVALVFARYRRSRVQVDQAPILGWNWHTIAGLLSWLFAPMLVAVVVSYLTLPVLSGRNMIIAQPALLLFLGCAATLIDVHWFRGRPWVSATSVCVILAHLVWARDYYERHQNRQYRHAAVFVAQHSAADGTPPLIATPSNWKKCFEYYWQRGSRFGMGLRDDLEVGATDRNFSARIARHNPSAVWLLVDPSSHPQQLPKQLPDYQLVQSEDFFGIAARKFVRREGPPRSAPSQARP